MCQVKQEILTTRRDLRVKKINQEFSLMEGHAMMRVIVGTQSTHIYCSFTLFTGLQTQFLPTLLKLLFVHLLPPFL